MGDMSKNLDPNLSGNKSDLSNFKRDESTLHESLINNLSIDNLDKNDETLRYYSLADPYDNIGELYQNGNLNNVILIKIINSMLINIGKIMYS